MERGEVRPVATADEAVDADHDGDVHRGDEGRQRAEDDCLVDHHVDAVQAVLEDCHSDSELLDDSQTTGVRPDSVQVLGGTLSLRLPTRVWVWLYSGLRSRRAPWWGVAQEGCARLAAAMPDSPSYPFGDL